MIASESIAIGVDRRSPDRRSPDSFFLVDLLHLFGDHFLLRDRGLLVFARGDARHRSRHQLTRAGAGSDDEFERVRELASVDHAVHLSERNSLRLKTSARWIPLRPA